MKTLKRIFIPGSEWFYLKIYSSPKTVDNLLTNKIHSVITILYKECLLKKFFFIRYADPDHHIRIRILLNNPNSINSVISHFNSHLKSQIESGLIFKIQIDTYIREIERYKPVYMEFSETLFYYDSSCVLSIIKYIWKLKNENYRWMAAIMLIDSMLIKFDLTLEERSIMLSNLSSNLKNEFGFDDYNSKQLNDIYRKWKLTIEQILKNQSDERGIILLNKYIINRANKIQETLVDCNINKEMICDIIPSYIHMTMNRLFNSSPRLHEFVIYFMLVKYYNSQIMRNTYNNSLK